MHMHAYTDSTTYTTCFETQGSHLEATCNSTCMHIVTMVTQSTDGRDKHLYENSIDFSDIRNGGSVNA